MSVSGEMSIEEYMKKKREKNEGGGRKRDEIFKKSRKTIRLPKKREGIKET